MGTETRINLQATGLWLAVQLVLAPVASAQAAIDSLFPATPSGPVTDVAAIIPDSVEAIIVDRLTRVRAATGGEVAVVTLPTLRGREPGEVALRIGRRWGVGGDYPVGDRRRNAGVVLLLVPSSPEQRGALYISTGQGVEGFLTDLRAGQISDEMLPALRDGDYGDAVDLGTALLADDLAQGLGTTDSTLLLPHEEPRSIVGLVLVAVLFGIVLVAILIAVAGSGGRKGAPRGPGTRRRRGIGPRSGPAVWGGMGGMGGFGRGGFGGGGFGGGGFGGFGGGGGFSGGGAGRGF